MNDATNDATDDATDDAMNDPTDQTGELGDEELAVLAALVARSGDALWAELPAGLEDVVVAAVAAEAAGDRLADDRHDTGAGPPDRADHAPPAPLDRLRRRRSSVPWWLSAAAAIAVVVAGVVLLTRGEGSEAIEFTLAGTEAAPDASAEVIMSTTPAGLKILLDADGLPGAPQGTYYEAWLNNGEISVSAGTFHLRGGSNQIELWAGVVTSDFHRLAVTLEPVDGDAGSSGDARLVGTFDLPD